MNNCKPLALLLLASCATSQLPPFMSFPRPPIPCQLPDLVVVPPDEPPYLKQLLNRAIHRWNEMTDRRLFVYGGHTLFDNEPGVFLARMATEEETREWPDSRHAVFLFDKDRTCPTRGVLLFRPYPMITQWDALHLENLIMHELRHALGLPHVLEDKHLMSVQWPLKEAQYTTLPLHETTEENVVTIYSIIRERTW